MMLPDTRGHPGGARDAERGIALVLVLLFLLAVSTIGTSMTVLARTESVSSVNYRMMSQARYGAESGVHRAINYLLNAYPRPGGAADPLTNYNMTVSPVTYLNQPVVLSSSADVTANYPSAAIRDAFAAAAQGDLSVGAIAVRYTSFATLVSMRPVLSYGAGTSTVVQTWRIAGVGDIAGVRRATVEVSAVLEQQIVSTHTYAAFATNAGCGALNFSGGVVTDSFDSGAITLVNGTPVTQSGQGDVGTNGNLTEGGGSIVNGSLSTPRSGVGNCHSGAVDALTQNGNAQLTAGLVQLPQAVQYSPPASPSPEPPETTMAIGANATCASAGISATVCSGAGGVLRITPTASAVALGNVRLTAGSTLHLAVGTYNVNSLTLAGNSNLVIDSGPVIMNLAGEDQSTVMDLTGGTTSNMSFTPALFQIQYAGAGTLKLNGGTAAAAMVYAPRSAISLSGGADFYGSLLGATVTISGGTKVHYDRHLGQTFFTVGNHMLNTFTWKKF